MSKLHYILASAVASAVLAFAAQASEAATILIGHNPNVNNGGLNIAQSPLRLPWVRTLVSGSNPSPGLELENDRGGPDGGDWILRTSDGSGSSPPHNIEFSQSFAPPNGPGLYDVSISGWTKSVASWWSGENFNWIQEAHIELWIDSGLVWSAMTSNNTIRNTWVRHEHEDLYLINTSVEARLRSIKGNDNFGNGSLGAIFGASRWDDIHLSVAFIPEPSSALLGLGAMGLISLYRRRRTR